MDKHTLKQGASGSSNLPRRDTRDSHGLRGFWDWPIVSDVARIVQQGLDVFEGKRTPQGVLLDSAPHIAGYIAEKIPGLEIFAREIEEATSYAARSLKDTFGIVKGME